MCCTSNALGRECSIRESAVGDKGSTQDNSYVFEKQQVVLDIWLVCICSLILDKEYRLMDVKDFNLSVELEHFY